MEIKFVTAAGYFFPGDCEKNLVLSDKIFAVGRLYGVEYIIILPSVLPAALMNCKVLSTALPGRFGTFILPQDAIVILKGKSRTHITDVHAMLHKGGGIVCTSTSTQSRHHRGVRACTRAGGGGGGERYGE